MPLFQVTEAHACYGIVTNRDGIVVESAPYGRKRWLGKHLNYVWSQVRRGVEGRVQIVREDDYGMAE